MQFIPGERGREVPRELSPAAAARSLPMADKVEEAPVVLCNLFASQD